MILIMFHLNGLQLMIFGQIHLYYVLLADPNNPQVICRNGESCTNDVAGIWTTNGGEQLLTQILIQQ